VIARGNFGGYVLTTERDMHPTKEKLLQRICAALGGRAAELEFGYGLTSGAAADLKAATKIATKMVCEYGMYENEVGIAVILEDEQYNYPDVKKLINRILEDQLKEARSIVDEHRDAMNRLVNEVMSSEQKYLTQKEILDAYKGEEGDRK
jgi:cell division protease FtsH